MSVRCVLKIGSEPRGPLTAAYKAIRRSPVSCSPGRIADSVSSIGQRDITALPKPKPFESVLVANAW